MSNGKGLTFALIDAKHCIALLNILEKRWDLAIPKRKTRTSGFDSLTRRNIKFAKSVWPEELTSLRLSELRTLSRESGLAITSGEILLLDGRWYITSAGLLRIAKNHGCSGIHTHVLEKFSDPRTDCWVFKATVYKGSRSKGFVGYGDADPSNVSPLVRGAEMRIAETRAVNRALRKAYGIGLCSVEELGSFSTPSKPVAVAPDSNGHTGSNGSGNGQPRLRDQLCLLIRQHNLDPNLVKAYAADFCGTQTLKEASRDLVESFIAQLAAFAKKDRDGLICKLNSYAQPVEATP